MNLSKVLKKKRDAEDRLRNNSPQPVYIESSTGEQSFVGTSEFATKAELKGKSNIGHAHDYSAIYAAIDHNHDLIYAHDLIFDGGSAIDNGEFTINFDGGGA